MVLELLATYKLGNVSHGLRNTPSATVKVCYKTVDLSFGRHRGVGHYLAGSLENGGENEGHECGSTSTYVGPKVEKKLAAERSVRRVGGRP
ncbi:hypothetical protein MTR67_004543 [Solanum verrucosum]|uniref:Uncharacterized protein n=1 Tax=Solanum verrucosum TaxID=315347 RepID=A0AAF0PU95_SOLVR|nr:hypothetical protein MTR67_004543 [Solanum verrucosum]